ncbi:MAG: peptide chain release factor 1 [Proteobacteria bacterium]|nr:peptide chain release factor 1 [Pseudomonadota bacterium]
MIPQAKLERVLDRHAAIEAQLAVGGSADFVKLSKEHAALAPVVDAIRAYKKTYQQIADNEALLADAASDAELRSLAREEIETLRAHFTKLERDVELHLLPKDAADSSSAIVEIRAGTGGEEAALFAGDLFKMYMRYAQLQGWKAELLSFSESDLGGVKEAVLAVEGEGAYAKLKFESGGHRVQRVPVTETGGRIHTSAATVAVLPEPEDVDVNILDKDLRIDVYRASGAGGQHVNKTDSAVRLTHLPTGIAVQCQNNRSQHRNRAEAHAMLRARLYELELQKREEEARAQEEAKSDIGWGHQIRSYVLHPYQMVKDLRTGVEKSNPTAVLDGDLDDFMAAALAVRVAEKGGESE